MGSSSLHRPLSAKSIGVGEIDLCKQMQRYDRGRCLERVFRPTLPRQETGGIALKSALIPSVDERNLSLNSKTTTIRLKSPRTAMQIVYRGTLLAEDRERRMVFTEGLEAKWSRACNVWNKIFWVSTFHRMHPRMKHQVRHNVSAALFPRRLLFSEGGISGHARFHGNVHLNC